MVLFNIPLSSHYACDLVNEGGVNVNDFVMSLFVTELFRPFSDTLYEGGIGSFACASLATFNFSFRMCACQLLQYGGQLESQIQIFLVDARCSFTPVRAEVRESYVWIRWV
jgi:hypothetical protein